MMVRRSGYEQKTEKKSFTGIQGEGGVGGTVYGRDAFEECRMKRGGPLAAMKIAAPVAFEAKRRKFLFYFGRDGCAAFTR